MLLNLIQAVLNQNHLIFIRGSEMLISYFLPRGKLAGR
jgi:hypothetical protein